MKKLLLIITTLVSIHGIAQISHGGMPVSFNSTLTPPPVHTTPVIDLQPYIEEDAVTDKHKDIAWRFGIEQFIHLNLQNSGIWETMPNGDRVWRIEIKSPNAKTTNLNYSSFHLPVGASFFVYNETQVLGSFTHENNKASGEFSTSLLQGESVFLEYIEPLSVQGQGVIEIASIVHGYRTLTADRIEAFGQSASCNVNAICDTSFWGNEIRSSVILMTSGNTRYCSGALLNNVLQDGTPYVLTADHCGVATNNIFMFNYQSPSCLTNIDGPTSQTISGCTIRASNTPSDFKLVELSSVPPSNYNVFYAGWSSVNVPPTKGTGIHYPVGDVKKISHDYDQLVESGYYSLGNNHWDVQDWNSGTTQGGSSGSPLFDQNHRVVGQLHGGDASCLNDLFDSYGKFSFSWKTDPLSSKQLKFWLDPNNSGDTILDGFDPNGPSLTTDAVLLDIGGVSSFVCGDSIYPKIIIRNHGSNNLTSLDVNYELDGSGYSQVNWSGNLAPYSIDSVLLPSHHILSGSHVFKANCTNPNGTNDENLSNDSSVVNFDSNDDPVMATLRLTTDNFGTETSWVVLNLSGDTVVQGGGYKNISGGYTITEELCLFDSCFTFVIYDSANDGFCCSFGSGQLQILNAQGDTLACIGDSTSCHPLPANNFVGTSLSVPFCLAASTESYPTADDYFNIYPNPTDGIFTIATKTNDPYDVIIYDVVGKLIYQNQKETKNQIQLDLSSVRKGVYFVSIVSENDRIVKRLVIK